MTESTAVPRECSRCGTVIPVGASFFILGEFFDAVCRKCALEQAVKALNWRAEYATDISKVPLAPAREVKERE